MADNIKTEQNKKEGGSGAGLKLAGMFKGIRIPAAGNHADKQSDTNLSDDLHRLSRTDLLEMLIDETKEADRLREENERLQEELAKCKADLDKTASLDMVIHRLERVLRESGH